MAGGGGGVDDNTAQANHIVVEHDVAGALTSPAQGGQRLDSGQAEGGHLITMHITQDPITGEDVTPAITAGNQQGCATIGVFDGTLLDARNGMENQDVSPTLQSHGQSYSLNAQPVTFQKVHRAANDHDPEKWEQREIAATLNTFDTGDTRAVDVIVDPTPQALSFNQRDEARMSDVAYTVQSQPGADEQLGHQPLPLLEVDGRTGKSTTDPRAGMGVGQEGDPMYTLQAGKQHGVHVPDQATTLTAGSHAPNVNPPGRRKEDDVNLVAALAERGRGDGAQLEMNDSGVYNTLRAGDGSSSRRQELLQGTMVRRLTPTECERLQGMPDDWTRWRVDMNPKSKRRGEVIEQSDSPRYKQIGNAVAVPVVEWIMHRLVAVDAGD